VKGKLKFILPVVALLVLGGAYKTVLAKPKEEPVPKVAGEVYVLPKEFLLNLRGDRYAKLSVALVMEPGHHAAGAAGGHGAAVKPPEGFGPLPQEALVRGLVTDTITGVAARDLIEPEGREKLKRKLLKKLKRTTDVHAEDVLFTDVAVQ
jgi:flagellar basal body-associated protein FliL